MKTRRGKFATVIAAVAVTAGVGGGVYAAGGTPEEQALAPARPPASAAIEKKVSTLLSQMSTDEKLQQVQLLADWQANEDR